MNLGLRYDKDFDFIGGSDIANSRTFQELQAIAPSSPLAASLVAKKATDYSKGFSPRVGFAYDLNGHGNHIVRAGFGMYYDNTFQNIPLFMEQQANNTIFQTAFGHRPTPDLIPGTACRFSRQLDIIGSPLARDPAGHLSPDSRLDRPPDGPELSHPGNRGVQRRLYLGDQFQVCIRSGICSRAQPA